MKANLISPRAQKSCRFLQDVTLRMQPRDLFLQRSNLGQIGLDLPIPGKRCGRGCGLFPYPICRETIAGQCSAPRRPEIWTVPFLMRRIGHNQSCRPSWRRPPSFPRENAAVRGRTPPSEEEAARLSNVFFQSGLCTGSQAGTIKVACPELSDQCLLAAGHEIDPFRIAFDRSSRTYTAHLAVNDTNMKT